MSIAGGLFNSNHKQENVGDTKSTADGDATGAGEAAVDLTTSIPGFDDDTDEGLVIETGGEVRDVEGTLTQGANEDVETVAAPAAGDEFAFDVDAPEDVPLDPES
ncbi:hypothetical protein [Ornithinimicrobium cavernae]|uniref:hypothetical protein n=1 Tax=Ornithinimicrobium cavernae TaxID=2666047 RepID=UPI000D691FE8|nr:hypothetical protein [Ornithinimicrobium cavernae]